MRVQVNDAPAPQQDAPPRQAAAPTTRILIIAGSDSGGGAGLQVDLKTVTMLGAHGATAVTAITAQNTQGVSAVQALTPELVIAQIDAVLNDIGADAIKIGMLGSAAIANAVATRLEGLEVPIVFDPVMASTSGAKLADDETVAAFDRLMRLATLVTPNLDELAELASGDDPVSAGLRLVSDHGAAVLVKGGHDSGEAVVDVLIETDNITTWQGSRLATKHTHGTGCTLASAIAVYLARGASLPMAVDRAREFVRLALHESPGLGQGDGPTGVQAVRLDVGGDLRLNQVTVCAIDYDESVRFYTELGLRQIVDSPPDYARFETAGGATFSVHHDPGYGAAGGTQVYFECDDLDGVIDRLSRQGFSFEHGPMNQPWYWREARLLDPFGNIVCLYKAGEARRYPPWRVS